MIFRYINKYVQNSYSRTVSNCRRFASANIETDPTARDPTPFFFNKKVQEYLKTLTTINYAKIFRVRKDGHKLKPPQYKFMTTEELEIAKEASKRKAMKYLQMPPVVKQRVDSTVPLCVDPALQSFDTSKYVFTDITYGLKDRQRFVVIREPNGTLRHATWQERDRIVQIYFPRPGKEVRKPKMFEEEYLKSILERNEYEFILDRACAQFEPDDPDYQATTREVYEYINNEKHFDTLSSTRHFGPMVFHLVWTRKIENLLCNLIENSRISDAALLIRLYHEIHPTTASAIQQCKDSDDVEFIMHYARTDSPKGSIIEKVLLSYKELHHEQKIVDDGVRKAHCISSETDTV